MMPSGHKSFLVNNVKDVELLMMHNRTYAAEYVYFIPPKDGFAANFLRPTKKHLSNEKGQRGRRENPY